MLSCFSGKKTSSITVTISSFVFYGLPPSFGYSYAVAVTTAWDVRTPFISHIRIMFRVCMNACTACSATANYVLKKKLVTVTRWKNISVTMKTIRWIFGLRTIVGDSRTVGIVRCGGALLNVRVHLVYNKKHLGMLTLFSLEPAQAPSPSWKFPQN